MKKNIAVVGFGFMSTTHTLNIVNNAKLRLTAIIDKNPENVHKNLSRQSGNFSTGNINSEDLSSIDIYSDFADYLKIEKPDAVAITVHTDLHHVLTKMALDSIKICYQHINKK